MSNKVTRVVVVDHTKNGEGRVLDKFCDHRIEYQDDGKTLKLFLMEKENGSSR